MKMFLMMLGVVALCVPAMAAEYVVDKAASRVSFSGTHAGDEFKGVFEAWDADIMFDADDLAASHVRATFDLRSAKTGSKMYDGTLPQGDWFDVKNTPEAVFESREVTVNSVGGYRVEGDFTLRGVAHPLSFDFTLSDLEGGGVRALAGFAIDRLLYGVGQKSDATAEWVSQEIRVELDIKADGPSL